MEHFEISIFNLFELIPITPLMGESNIWTILLVNGNPRSEYYKNIYLLVEYEENQVDIHLLYKSDNIESFINDSIEYESRICPFSYCYDCKKIVMEHHKDTTDIDSFGDYLYYKYIFYKKY